MIQSHYPSVHLTTEITKFCSSKMDECQNVEFRENLNKSEAEEEEINPNSNTTNFNKHLLFSAIFCFKFLGLVNYICDVGSDIKNGIDYLRVPEEWPKLSDGSGYNYTREHCDEWETFRHEKMGTMTLCIIFIPSAIGFFFLGKYLHGNLSCKAKFI